MKVTSRLVLSLILASFFAAPSRAQDLGETLRQVGQAYSEEYVQPLVNAFGADINSGLFHSARIGGGLLPVVDVYLGLKTFAAFVPSEQQMLSLSYTAPQTFTGPDGQSYTLDVTYTIDDAPTIFGETDTPGIVTAQVNEAVHPGPDNQFGTDDDVIIDETASLDLLPGLINTSVVPLLVPQLHVGSLFGTDVMIRHLPRIEREDVGALSFIGFGVRHSISQYIPLMPVNIAAQVTWQNLDIQDADDNEVFSASMFAGSLMASRAFFIASLYGGLQVESANVDIDYTFTPEDPSVASERISFSLQGSNRFRMVLGGALSLGPLLVNVDYNIGNINVVSAGIGLSL